ncbi:MAG TPA: GTPase RsgA [Nocardioidaceae bacterium]|nr:GTPase RsgA [Nocardioidaceae bacterium]
MLETIGWTPDLARAAADGGSVGRVARVDRGLASVLTEAGPLWVSFGGAVLSGMAESPLTGPCTGDWVLIRDWPDRRSTLERVLPRRTTVVLAAGGGQSHGELLCANVDVVALVVAVHPLPVLSEVERLVALAWRSGARPAVVLTKADLVTDARQVARDVSSATPGVEVVIASTRTGEGVDTVREWVDNRLTLALLGASGHGKSTLTNALVGVGVLRTRDLRADGRGRHSSVRRELVPLPGGGAVIDGPGLRGVELVHGGPAPAEKRLSRR